MHAMSTQPNLSRCCPRMCWLRCRAKHSS